MDPSKFVINVWFASSAYSVPPVLVTEPLAFRTNTMDVRSLSSVLMRPAQARADATISRYFLGTRDGGPLRPPALFIRS